MNIVGRSKTMPLKATKNDLKKKKEVNDLFKAILPPFSQAGGVDVEEVVGNPFNLDISEVPTSSMSKEIFLRAQSFLKFVIVAPINMAIKYFDIILVKGPKAAVEWLQQQKVSRVAKISIILTAMIVLIWMFSTGQFDSIIRSINGTLGELLRNLKLLFFDDVYAPVESTKLMIVKSATTDYAKEIIELWSCITNALNAIKNVIASAANKTATTKLSYDIVATVTQKMSDLFNSVDAYYTVRGAAAAVAGGVAMYTYNKFKIYQECHC